MAPQATHTTRSPRQACVCVCACVRVCVHRHRTARGTTSLGRANPSQLTSCSTCRSTASVLRAVTPSSASRSSAPALPAMLLLLLALLLVLLLLMLLLLLLGLLLLLLLLLGRCCCRVSWSARCSVQHIRTLWGYYGGGRSQSRPPLLKQQQTKCFDKASGSRRVILQQS